MPEYEDVHPSDIRLSAARICHAKAVKLISQRCTKWSPEWQNYLKWANKVCPDRHKLPPDMVLRGSQWT